MILTIEIPDKQAAALQAKAASEGLTLEDWFRRLAGAEVPSGQAPSRRIRHTLSELVEQCDPHGPPSAEDRLWMDTPAVGGEVL